MPGGTRFEPSSIKNKVKREEVAKKAKRAKSQQKLLKRLARAKFESTNPAAKKERLAQNVPRTLDNMRVFDPTTTSPSIVNKEGDHDEATADMASDPFEPYFTSTDDPMLPPKILITTSPKATKATYDVCDELVGIFPGAEFIRRKKGKEFELGKIAGWAADRGYKHMCVVNEDMKKPNAITLIYLPNGPTAYFKLSSVVLSQKLFGRARATPHNPELVLNNFVTRLGHAVGRMFQTCFPPMPEFQGRQVVTLHNQRDFLFFRRHRYAFRSTERVELQEIGPRFTLKLRWLKKGIPAVHDFSEGPLPLELGIEIEADQADKNDVKDAKRPKVVPPKQDEFLWAWKSELETTRHTFFL